MTRGRLQRRLTEQGIERLNYNPAFAPPSGRMEIEDELCPGLVLRVTPRGAKSFSVIYKVPGEGGTNASGRLIVGSQHRITLGSTPPLELKAAREQARKIIQTATEGRDPRNDRRERNLMRHINKFAATRKRFIDLEIRPNVKAWKGVDSVLRLHVEPKWGDRPIHDIRRSDVHELLDTLVERGKPFCLISSRRPLCPLWRCERRLLMRCSSQSKKGCSSPCIGRYQLQLYARAREGIRVGSLHGKLRSSEPLSAIPPERELTLPKVKVRLKKLLS
jgi:hypothetical protein